MLFINDLRFFVCVYVFLLDIKYNEISIKFLINLCFPNPSCFHSTFTLSPFIMFFGFVSVLWSWFFQIKGRMVSYFMGLSKRPLTVFGICSSIITSLILLTICISTILYCNAVKKSRINPESNYIKVIRRMKWDTTGTSRSVSWLLSVKENCNFFKLLCLFILLLYLWWKSFKNIITKNWCIFKTNYLSIFLKKSTTWPNYF